MPTPVVTFGPVDARSLDQLKRCAEAGDAVAAVLCADHHPGYSQPIGGVVAYRDKISPSGVGYDIACGNKAVLTDLFASDIRAELPRLMDEIQERISFGIGRKNNEPVDDAVIDNIREADFAPQRALLDLAAAQLGTVGSGNHYVDLFEDESGQLWVGVHFGSRGFGHKTASGFLALAAGLGFDEHAKEGEMDSPPILFDTASDLGQSYISAMFLAGQYAYAGRNAVVDKVLDILGAKTLDSIHNHHNFAWLEQHGGEELWVIRKGATPARPGQRGFVGGSMGDSSVILQGIRSPEAEAALYSTVHGAGRVMSRTEAAGKYVKRTITGTAPDGTTYTKKIRERDPSTGRIDWPAVRADLATRGIELRGAGADEAPGVYKSLPEVLAFHDATIYVATILHPIGVCMAGADTYDPYKD